MTLKPGSHLVISVVKVVQKGQQDKSSEFELVGVLDSIHK